MCLADRVTKASQLRGSISDFFSSTWWNGQSQDKQDGNCLITLQKLTSVVLLCPCLCCSFLLECRASYLILCVCVFVCVFLSTMQTCFEKIRVYLHLHPTFQMILPQKHVIQSFLKACYSLLSSSMSLASLLFFLVLALWFVFFLSLCYFAGGVLPAQRALGRWQGSPAAPAVGSKIIPPALLSFFTLARACHKCFLLHWGFWHRFLGKVQVLSIMLAKSFFCSFRCSLNRLQCMSQVGKVQCCKFNVALLSVTIEVFCLPSVHDAKRTSESCHSVGNWLAWSSALSKKQHNLFPSGVLTRRFAYSFGHSRIFA